MFRRDLSSWLCVPLEVNPITRPPSTPDCLPFMGSQHPAEKLFVQQLICESAPQSTAAFPAKPSCAHQPIKPRSPTQPLNLIFLLVVVCAAASAYTLVSKGGVTVVSTMMTTTHTRPCDLADGDSAHALQIHGPAVLSEVPSDLV